MNDMTAKSTAREGDGVAVIGKSYCYDDLWFREITACGVTFLVSLDDEHKARHILLAALQAQQGADGVALIAAERQRQVSVEGWTSEQDDDHARNELATAAACYAAPDACGYVDDDPTSPRAAILPLWPWSRHWWKPGDRIRELTKAGALIAAEIDRLQRAGAPR